MKKDAIVFMLMKISTSNDVNSMRKSLVDLASKISGEVVGVDSSVRERIVSLVSDSGGITKKKLISTTAGIEGVSKVKVIDVLSELVSERVIDVDCKRKIGSNRSIVYVMRDVELHYDEDVKLIEGENLSPSDHLARARMVRGVIIELMKSNTDKKVIIDKAKDRTGVPHEVVLKQYRQVTELGLTADD